MNNRGGFFSYFKELASKANKTTNSKEAIAIRNKLIKIGIVFLVIGIIGDISCFISFGVNAFSNVQNMDFNFGKVLIPFFLTIPFMICTGIGAMSLYCGLGITVAKVTAKFVDTNKYCPHCGDVVKDGEMYCDKCGKPLLTNKICKNCNTENELHALYCMKCGTKLED